MIFKMKIKLAITALCAALLTGCGVAIKYSLSGASIPPDARTFSVAYFPNNATMVAPILSSTLTDALVDMFTRRTRLMQKRAATSLSKARSSTIPPPRRRCRATITPC